MSHSIRIPAATLVASMLLSAAIAHPAQADVVLASTGSITGTAKTTSGAANSLTVSGFDMGNGNAIAIVITSESATSTNPTNYAVTFNGNAVTLHESDFFSTTSNTQGAAVYYAINPSSTSGDVVVSFGQNITGAVSVLSLQNVAGVSDSNSFASGGGVNGNANGSTPDTYTLNYGGQAGGLVVAGFIDNAFAGAAVPTITGGNVDTSVQSLAWNFGTGTSSGIVHGYGDIPSTGPFTETFTESSGNSTRNAAALVAFNAVAVPAPAALPAGLAALGLLAMRRRR